MKVALIGGTGMIGSWLAQSLRERGDEVLILTRQKPRHPGQIRWDLRKGIQGADRLEGTEAVVNLTGAPLADRPWTRARRRTLWESRVDATAVLLEGLAGLPEPPKVFLGAGGLGIYGDRGDEVLDESQPPGTGFLAELAEAWEEAHLRARRIGARAAVLRMSIVLSPTGGAFPLMVKPFRVGVGGWLGNGRQYTSWLTIRDAVAAFQHLLDDERCEGAFNGTVPEPTTNKEWVKALGHVLHTPIYTHAPRWALRGALGELANDLLIASVRAVPSKLLDHGFTFRDGDAEEAFRWLVAEVDRSA